METFLLESNGAIPADPMSYDAAQFARVSVTRDSRRLRVESVPGTGGVTPTDNATTSSGSKTVAATGTPEALGTGTFSEVLIFPLRSNTGPVYIGLSSTNDSQHGTVPVGISAPNNKLIDISTIYVDVTVNGEGVYWIGLK